MSSTPLSPPAATALPIEVSVEPTGGMARVMGLWCALETRATVPFFLTSHWIGPWLESLPESDRPAQLLIARQGGQCVGLALLGQQALRAFGLPLGRALHLNETGLVHYDLITIEHNGFLVEAAAAPQISQAMARELSHLAQGVDRLWARALDQSSHWPQIPPAAQLNRHDQRLSCWSTDIRAMRERGADLPQGLSPKRRAHLRRSLRAYEQVGALTIAQAPDAEQALAWFERLLVWHGQRRLALGRASEFDTPYARRFHTALIRSQFAHGVVQLLCVRCGDQELGYLYSFVHGGRVNFYQSGFNYDLLDGKQSPGMVCLVLALRHSAAQGHDVFDFLAGDSQYKAALGTQCEELHTVLFERAGALAWATQVSRWWREKRHQLLSRAAPSLLLFEGLLREGAGLAEHF